MTPLLLPSDENYTPLSSSNSNPGFLQIWKLLKMGLLENTLVCT